MSQRFEGRNLEEALGAASSALGVERWQLTYHVLVEKRGFLGGMKRVVLEAEVNTEAAPPPEPPAPAPRPVRTAPAGASGGASRGPRERSGGRGRGERSGRHGERGGFERGGRAGREGRGRDRERPRRPRGGTFIGDLPDQSPRSEAAGAAVQWIEELLTLADLDVVTRSEENDERIVVRLYGDDAEALTDRHGELLDAIQVLVNKALVGRKLEKDVELDCEEFKERRVADLESRAREVADRIRREGGEELLPAMTPIERRIVHLALHDDAEVTTESRGDGFYKRVAIVLRGREEAPAGEPSPSEP